MTAAGKQAGERAYRDGPAAPGAPRPRDPVFLGPQCHVCLLAAVDPVKIGSMVGDSGPGYAAYACRMCAAEEGIPIVD